MKSLDLKWYEKIEKIEEFIVNATNKGWEVKVSFETANELFTLKIMKKQERILNSKLQNWKKRLESL